MKVNKLNHIYKNKQDKFIYLILKKMMYNKTREKENVMKETKTQELLKNSVIGYVVGQQPQKDRSVLKMIGASTLLVAVATIGFASNVSARDFTQNNPQYTTQQQVVENPAIPATVVQVRKLSSNQTNVRDKYEREDDRAVTRTQNLIGTVIGTATGYALADKASSRNKGFARTLGSIIGGVAGNKIAKVIDERRQNNQEANLQSGNVRYINNAYEVTVNLNLGAGQVEQVAITQSNGEFRRGDSVFVVSNRDGTANVVSEKYMPTNTIRRNVGF